MIYPIQASQANTNELNTKEHSTGANSILLNSALRLYGGTVL